jgi:3-deoxy-manno-octulosonate cytidylyltransferase (CMP-KDO synthetase)
MLLPIAGKPLILHTLERTLAATTIDRAIVATDDERIRDVVSEAGGEVVMTSGRHLSGSDRVAEVAKSLDDGSIIVNVQGDEPLISPDTIDSVVKAMFDDPTADISTAWEPITSLSELLNGNNVKVVVGDDGHAIYFSRSPMPFPREASLKYNGDPGSALRNEPELFSNFRKHTGIYAYRRSYLLEFTRMPPTALEQFEMLEQLRALENGARIKVVRAASSIGVDTRADLERVRRIVETPDITYREATRDDIPKVARVHIESWKRSFDEIAPKEFLDGMSVEKRIQAFSERFENEESFYMMFVAENKDKEIIGFADFGESRGKDGYDSELYAIYFLPGFQRKGIGSHLFRMCQLRMAASGSNSMCLDSLEVSPYRGFYEKLGGEIVGDGSHDLAGREFKTVLYGWNDLSEFR